MGRRLIKLPPSEVKKIYDESGSLKKAATALSAKENTLLSYMQRKGLERNPPSPKVNPCLKSSPELAYILGVLMGDGSVYVHRNKRDKKKGGKRVRLMCRSEEFADKFRARLKYVGLHPWRWIDGQGYHIVIAVSAKFYDWYRSLDHTSLLFTGMQHPKDFLGGLFDSEGYYQKGLLSNKYNWTVYFTNQKTGIMSLFVETAKVMGFNFRVGKSNSCLRAWLCGKEKTRKFTGSINTFRR